MTDTTVSIIIPTFNGRRLLEQQLPVVEKIMRTGDELMIVDDASGDGSIDWLTERYGCQLSRREPELVLYEGKLSKRSANPIKLIALNQNMRFAKAVNTGVKMATQPLVLLLNNDVIPGDRLLEILTSFFTDQKMFAVGCHELEGEAPTLHGGKNRLWFERGIFQHARAKEFTTGPTAWVSGGSGLFNRNKWLQLGGFDQAFYPAYWEDTDLSLRAQRRGWKTWFCAEAIVYHNHETTNRTAFGKSKIAAISWQHQQYFTRKHANLWQLLEYYFWKPYWWWKMRS